MRIPGIPRHIVQLIFLVLIVASLVFVVLNQLSWFFLLLLLLFLIILLWWLLGGEGGPPPDEAPEYPPEKFYIQDEIIISGPEAAVTDAVEAIKNRVQLALVEDRLVVFGGLPEEVRSCYGDCSDVDPADYVIYLYKITGEEQDVRAAIEAINDAVGRGSSVRAEPNWLSGYPWEPAGSPWEPAGSPWEPAGSSDGKQNSAPADLFMTQWAFEQIGLHRKRDNSSGRSVRVGVFDTSPFGNDVAPASLQQISWVNDPASFSVSVTNYPTPPNEDVDVDLSNHGLFAAGMTHALAQNADIQIYRVLNENNFGDIFSLIWALYNFVLENAPSTAPEGQIGAVINMSLGIRVPPDKAKMPLPMEVQALRDILRAAKCANIVVVAASGNNSANLPEPEPAHLPGNWPEIIGVAASNQQRGRSRFSNRGNLAAPGGDARLEPGDPDIYVPGNDSCGSENCEYAVVGPVMMDEENRTGFAYWSGTSFASPMVAGLAACVIEMGRGQLSADQVREIIECGARVIPVDDPGLGVGIINVPETLDNFYACLERLGISIERPEKGYDGEGEEAAV